MGEVRRTFTQEEIKEAQDYYGAKISLLNGDNGSMESGFFSGTIEVAVVIRWTEDGFTDSGWDYIGMENEFKGMTSTEIDEWMRSPYNDNKVLALFNALLGRNLWGCCE